MRDRWVCSSPGQMIVLRKPGGRPEAHHMRPGDTTADPATWLTPPRRLNLPRVCTWAPSPSRAGGGVPLMDQRHFAGLELHQQNFHYSPSDATAERRHFSGPDRTATVRDSTTSTPDKVGYCCAWHAPGLVPTAMVSGAGGTFKGQRGHEGPTLINGFLRLGMGSRG